jgi:N-acetyl-alpha-D-muramate 1-phosphate uridylyltransferase
MPEPMPPVAILAGGLATRLWPLTQRLPKAMIDVLGEPFVAHQLRLLRTHGFERVVICAGFLGEQIEAFVGDGSRFGLSVVFSFDQPRLLGTAGALRHALPLLGDSFFVLYGDSYLPCAYRRIQAEFRSAGKAALMTVFRNADRWDRSNVEFVNGQIVRYDKRAHDPNMHHIDYGLGVLSRAALAQVPAGQPYDLERVYQHLLQRGGLAGFEVHERFYEVGSFAGIQELAAYLSGNPLVALEADG